MAHSRPRRLPAPLARSPLSGPVGLWSIGGPDRRGLRRIHLATTGSDTTMKDLGPRRGRLGRQGVGRNIAGRVLQGLDNIIDPSMYFKIRNSRIPGVFFEGQKDGKYFSIRGGSPTVGRGSGWARSTACRRCRTVARSCRARGTWGHPAARGRRGGHEVGLWGDTESVQAHQSGTLASGRGRRAAGG